MPRSNTIASANARSAALGPRFSLLWAGESVSLLGTATTAVLIPLLAVTHFHAGAGWMGLLTAATWLPWLVLGLPAGALVDRLDPRTVMITADLVAAGAVGSVPLAWWLGRLSLSQLLLVALTGGVATVFFRTAYVKLLPMIVAEPGLERANARLYGTESAMQVAGPGLAGVMAQAVPAAVGLVLDVLGFVVSAVCLRRIRTERTRQPASTVKSLSSRIVEGVRSALGDRHLRALMIIGGVSNFGLAGYAALLVLFLVGDLGLSPGVLGLVLMVGSVGGLLGAVVAPPLARRIGAGRASTVLFLVSGPGALLVGAPRDGGHAYLTAAGLMLVGLGVVGGNVLRAAWRQRYVPAELLGRVVTTGQVVLFGTMPLAGLAAGGLGVAVGVRPTVLAMAGVHLVACVAVLGTRFGRGREFPVRTDA